VVYQRSSKEKDWLGLSGWNDKRGVLDEWKSLPVDFINGLVSSMPRRIEAVIMAQGGNEFRG